MQEEQKRSRATDDSGSAEDSELQAILNQCLALINYVEDSKKKSQQWLTHTGTLLLLELNTAVLALQRKLLIAVLMFFLMILLIAGICIVIGMGFYQWIPSLFLSSLISVGSLALFILVLAGYMRYLDKFITLRHTKEQIREGIELVTQQQSKKNSN